MTSYNTLSFTRQTMERIVTDLHTDAGRDLTGSWSGDTLTLTTTPDHDGDGFTYTVTPKRRRQLHHQGPVAMGHMEPEP
ncbi:hypothetical protein ACIO1C_22445 [Streptomyces sp. NPDC087420]|uniref:hypothetical protein n=1 Tax=Streptomyces sp. NPDC087420 TaxID=3365785 RepID=UPI0038398067